MQTNVPAFRVRTVMLLKKEYCVDAASDWAMGQAQN